MAAGDVKIAYGSFTAFTVTNLHSCGASATHVAGWNSNEVDNSSNLYSDYAITGEVTVAASGLAAGQIRVHVVATEDGTNYPDTLTSSEAEPITITSAEIRNAICKVGAVIETDTTADRVYPFTIGSVAELFGGRCPQKFVLFITQSTTQALAASGNIVEYQGSYHTVAQS